MKPFNFETMKPLKNMDFLNSTSADISAIFNLYDAAVAHQKAVSKMHWLPFDEQMVLQEIAEGRQWKIMVDGQIACIFVITYTDADIWGERDKEPSIYFHRIVTDPAFRGRKFVQEIVKWGRVLGKSEGKKYLRLDTWSDNLKLKEVYEAAGFTFLGIGPPANPAGLPKHYSTITLGYFEMGVE